MSAQAAFIRQTSGPRRRLGYQHPLDPAAVLHRATSYLAEQRPEFSARQVITRRQGVFLAMLAVAAAGACAVWPERTAEIVVTAMSLGFLQSLTLRCTLAWVGRGGAAPCAAVRDDALPVYSILVPVYREAGMIPQLAQGLSALDYPASKLDIWLVVEADDDATRLAVRAAGLRAIAVPPAQPRTKPKACNYALQFARGELIVVYDAEDRPEPDQLRKAAAAFRDHPGVSCFQARLSVDRAPSWIARMFAIDYALWFHTLLPGLSLLRAPIPLGGTSNHFRTAALIAAGAWDPHNVTEDADLGVRLARLGHRVAILDSATFEEAPLRLGPWLRQRTRWMKGYMQTLLVHFRDPKALIRQVGAGGVLLILAFLGGAVWSALVNPLLWMVCIAGAISNQQGASTLEWLARICGTTLLAANILLAVQAALGGGRWQRKAGVAIVLSYPLYWLLISVATYRALWQLLRDPFRWEKTPHGSALQ